MAAFAFGGTTQKCKACEKTVYLVDQLTADSKVYHKACFRCHHCKGTLKLSNYSSLDGVLYCKPHFDQLFKLTGSLDKSFDGTPKTVRVKISAGQTDANRKFSSQFGGTQDKCVVCTKTVYPIEKVSADSKSYHKSCFRCTHGGCVISPSNYIAHDHHLYCRHHHNQLFKQKGNFSQLGNQENIKTVTANTVAQENVKTVTENTVAYVNVNTVTENTVAHVNVKTAQENTVAQVIVKPVTENNTVAQENVKTVTENNTVAQENIKTVTENTVP